MKKPNDDAGYDAAFAEMVHNQRAIDWDHWVHRMPMLTAAQAARLMSGLDPDVFENLDNRPIKDDDPSQLCDKAKKIQRLADTKDRQGATPSEWLEWADEHGFEVHDLFRIEVEAASCDAPAADETGNATLTGNSARRAAINKQGILAVDWPLLGNFDQDSLSSALSDVPNWLLDARISKGAPGKASALWNPALIASCLAVRGHANSKALTTFIRNSFSEWLNEWEQMQEHL